jgi:hypothetical protein
MPVAEVIVPTAPEVTDRDKVAEIVYVAVAGLDPSVAVTV